MQNKLRDIVILTPLDLKPWSWYIWSYVSC